MTKRLFRKKISESRSITNLFISNSLPVCYGNARCSPSSQIAKHFSISAKKMLGKVLFIWSEPYIIFSRSFYNVAVNSSLKLEMLIKGYSITDTSMHGI